MNFFLAHLSRRLIGELIGYSWSGVCLSSSVVHNAQYKLALATCSGVQNFRIVMQRFVSNWLCSIKKLWKRRQIFFFLIPPTFTSDMSGKKIADIEFYFFFFFVLRLSHLAEKICKTKNKKTLALALVYMFGTHLVYTLALQPISNGPFVVRKPDLVTTKQNLIWLYTVCVHLLLCLKTSLPSNLIAHQKPKIP